MWNECIISSDWHNEKHRKLSGSVQRLHNRVHFPHESSGCCFVRWLTTWGRDCDRPLASSHVRGDVAIFHPCDCSQNRIALEATLKARSWLSELNANGCFYKELFSLVVLSWSLYYWVMDFYYEDACHIGDCMWNSLGNFKWKRTCCSVPRQLPFDISFNGHVCESRLCEHEVFLWR